MLGIAVIVITLQKETSTYEYGNSDKHRLRASYTIYCG